MQSLNYIYIFSLKCNTLKSPVFSLGNFGRLKSVLVNIFSPWLNDIHMAIQVLGAELFSYTLVRGNYSRITDRKNTTGNNSNLASVPHPNYITDNFLSCNVGFFSMRVRQAMASTSLQHLTKNLNPYTWTAKTGVISLSIAFH